MAGGTEAAGGRLDPPPPPHTHTQDTEEGARSAFGTVTGAVPGTTGKEEDGSVGPRGEDPQEGEPNATMGAVKVREPHLPVCVSADVIYEGEVLQSRLDLPERNILPGLELHEVLLPICQNRGREGTRELSATVTHMNTGPSLRTALAGTFTVIVTPKFKYRKIRPNFLYNYINSFRKEN